jgi:D-glycerate 3-kinase
MPADHFDDKSEHCVSFILECLQAHRTQCAEQIPVPPLMLGVNGIQGSGKTTLVGV